MRLLLILAIIFAAGPALAADQLRIIDGDTLILNGERIRLYGMDAPEGRQACILEGGRYPCGQDSTDALRANIGGQDLSCDPVNKDRYGRKVVVCHIPGAIDIGRQMVRTGWAFAYPRYSTDYVADEDYARKNRLGLWRGSFRWPWEWRRR